MAQRLELPDRRGQKRERVPAQVQGLERLELPDGGMQLTDLIRTARELLEAAELPEVLWQRDELIMRDREDLERGQPRDRILCDLEDLVAIKEKALKARDRRDRYEEIGDLLVLHLGLLGARHHRRHVAARVESHEGPEPKSLDDDLEPLRAQLIAVNVELAHVLVVLDERGHHHRRNERELLG